MLSLCYLTLRGCYCYSHFTDGETEVETDNLQGHRPKPASYISIDCQATNFSYNTVPLIRTLCENLTREDFGCQPTFLPSTRVLFRLELGINYGLCVCNHKYAQFKIFTKSNVCTGMRAHTHTHSQGSSLNDPDIKRHPGLPWWRSG